MRKNTIHIVIFALFVIIIFISSKIAPIVKSGYDMYKTAVSQTKVSDKIKEIRSQKGYVKLNNISTNYINKLLKSEDKRFYYHFGIDPIAIGRALYNNIKAGSFVQGGSTITQQLAKNMYFTFEKKYERKIAELFVALELENQLSKDEILELYCNVVYFGEGCYGINEASNHYFDIKPINLSEKQACALVHTIKNPNNNNPNKLKQINRTHSFQNVKLKSAA